jgi:hypothetical protein
MKRALLSGLVALSLAFAGGVAHAQDAAAAPAPAPAAGAAPAAGGGTTYKKVTNYDFENDDITGELVRPDGDFIGSRKATVHSSLIKLRANFVPEMLKSANEV